MTAPARREPEKLKQPDSAGNGRENGGLSPKQEAAALSLAVGRTIEDAAGESGAGSRTIRTWLRDEPAFPRRVSELRAEMTARAVGRLADGMASAADTLGYLCRKARSETVRLGAARALLELGNKLRESVELEDRLTALEARSGRRR
jgi:hypothetical protein